MAVIGTDLNEARKILDSEQLVAIPTETVYGLAGNAFSEKAVLSIFHTKNRPSFDPLIAHTDSLEKVAGFVKSIPSVAEELANAFWPGPLTILLERNNRIPDVMTSGLPRVAVRIPNHQLSLSLLSTLDYPVAAPSANPFGYVSPTSAQHVENNLGDKIKYILDGGDCQIGVESTIVGFENNELIVYRLGGLTLESLEEVAGPLLLRNNQSSNPSAPGMIKSHYAPTKPLTLLSSNEMRSVAQINQGKAGFITFSRFADLPYEFKLTESGDLEEAASSLFTALRHFESLPVDRIYAERVPDEGLGRAINDRLQRAAAK
ncbi:MAG: L-threonylcarbamoyladenylate synthase [Bacteroidota bacterium]